MRLVANQRLWTCERLGEWRERRVDSIGRKWASVGDRRVAIESAEVRHTDGSYRTAFYTDNQRAEAEEYSARNKQAFAVTKAAASASLETLNNAAAAFGIPPAVAWVSEST